MEPVAGVEPASDLLTMQVPSHEGQTGKLLLLSFLSMSSEDLADFDKAMLGLVMMLVLLLYGIYELAIR